MDSSAAQTQHRLGAMLMGMDVILPIVQHLHALTCQFKNSKQSKVLGYLETNSIADVDVL